jgi:proteic killer suppression protein
VIKSFRHKGLEKFFLTKSKAGIQAHHAKKLTIQLGVLHTMETIDEMDLSGWGLHPLHGDLEHHWAVKVNGNWRLTFKFEDRNVYLIDYKDYH